MSYYITEHITWRFVADTLEEVEKAFAAFEADGYENDNGFITISGTDIQLKLAEYETERGE
jgi:hypothetical protein